MCRVRICAAAASARAAIGESLHAQVAWLPDGFGRRPHDARDVILHVIAETACHAGHPDAARELIDGRRWTLLDE